MTITTRFELALPDWVPAFIDGWSEPLETPRQRMALAIALSSENIDRETGGPFGAIVVEEADGRLLGVGVNRVTQAGLSMAHAEIVAMSLAQASRKTWNLDAGAAVQLVTSCEPCAMCFGAIPWSGIRSLAWGASREDAEACGFDEGNKPSGWRETLESRGIATQGEVLRVAAAAVMARYVHSDGTIYHPEKLPS
jgi:tRNA(Arg) A34 adenosine deaminase TadA